MGQARYSITPADAWEDQRLTPLQCRLLGLIGAYLGKDYTAWPSQTTLAEKLGVTRKAVNEGVKALVGYGYLIVEKRHREDGGQTSNFYRVVMDDFDRSQASACNPSVTPLSPQSYTPLSPLEVTPPVTSKGYTMKEPIELPNKKCGKSALEEIWKHWSPRGRERSKSKANLAKQLDALSKAKGYDLDQIVTACTMYAKTTAGEYHKGLHLFLTGGQWENWIGQDMTPQEVTLDDWKAAARAYVDAGIWPAKLGPPPHEANCEAPDGILKGILSQIGTGHKRAAGVAANLSQPLKAINGGKA